MNPTPAEIENGIPRTASANNPPVAAIGTATLSIDLGDGECMADGVGCTTIDGLAVEVYRESSSSFNCPKWVLFEVADAEAGPYRPVAKVEPNWTCTADKDFEVISAEGLHTRGDWVRVTVRSATTNLLGLARRRECGATGCSSTASTKRRSSAGSLGSSGPPDPSPS